MAIGSASTLPVVVLSTNATGRMVTMKRNAKNVVTTLVIVKNQNDDENRATTAYMIILHSEDDVRWVLVGWRRQLGYALVLLFHVQ